jgi:hypothetical protein
MLSVEVSLAIALTFVLRLKDENKRHFVARFFLKQFRVSLSDHCVGVLHSHLLHGVFYKTKRYLLDVEYIVGIEHRFKVRSFQERLIEPIEVLVKRVFPADMLLLVDGLQSF